MRLTSLITSAAALILVGAAPAFAADPIPAPIFVPPAPEPEPERGFTWTGGYIGGHAGIGRGRIDNGGTCEDGGTLFPIHFLVEELDGDLDWGAECDWNFAWGAFGEPGTDFNVGVPTPITGFLAGAQIGFNLQLGGGGGGFGFVVGAEVAFSATSLSAALDAEYWDDPDFDWNSEFRINHLTTATVRAGAAFGRFMIYGEIGLALANATWVNTLGFTDTATDHGLVFGAGIEAMVSNTISLFVEWNQVRIRNHEWIGTIDPFVIALPTGVRVASTTNIFKVGFNIALGGE
jgi:opacity protein-like surface antigen